MKRVTARAFLLGGSILLAGGCATTEEWGEWRAHSSHYASDQHLDFSMRNDAQGSPPKVTRSDVAAAQTQNWWGKAITVQTSQIFQN
jgi:hypothetical protein